MENPKQYKKYILIALVALTIALGPFTAKTALAWLPSLFPSIEDLAATFGNLILWLVSWGLWLTANLFEYTLKLTLKNSTFANLSVINLGWSIVRDVVNLFFIFILLYIAIGAILRLAGHDAKKLLVNLILAALLINFSLVITKVIIDASNILALEFYAKISGENKSVTQTLMNGLHLTSIYNKEALKTRDAPDPEKAGFANIILGTLGGSALILVTAFVFLAATFLFIARTIVLWFLMILSPLAFGAMILPQTKKHADRWWQELTCQCLLAPAFMFMIYLVVMIIKNSDFNSAISGITGQETTDNFAAAFTSGVESSLGVILNFVLLIGLMIGSLIVSKNLACAGGAEAMRAANWTKGKVQGYAKSYAKRGAGAAAEGAMKGLKAEEEKGGFRGGFARTFKAIPGVGRGLAALSAGREEELAAKRKQYAQQYKGYSEAGLQTMLETPAIAPEKRKVIESIQKERQMKKEAEVGEKAAYKEIVGGEETIKDKVTGEPIKITTTGKLGEIDDQLKKITGGKSKDASSYLDNLEAQLENLRGSASPDASTKREGIIFQRGKINKLMKEKEKLEARKEKLEEKQQSQTKEKKLEERLGKIETEKPKT
ncbi:MAG: type IV secretion system protein [Patescibacteria group bacterium]